MDEKISQERRLILRVLDYWHHIRGERSLPSPDDINPAVFGEDWHDCFLMDLTQDSTEPRFRYVGRNLLNDSHLPQDWAGPSGQALSECPDETLLARSAEYISRVLAKNVPISLGDEFTEGKSLVKFRSILLPLSSDGTNITTLLGAANCLRVPAVEEENLGAE